ncbi:MAG: endonuclease III [Clostridia bacterium]|nr:endonuclease III [Clostridia bacterium]
MTKKKRANKICELLKLSYPEAVCQLNADTPFQLLVATRLSAQCTDARVNLVTPALFEKYPSENEMAEAPVEDIENLIHSCGFYHGKARDLIGMAQAVRDVHKGTLPDTIEELTKLPGVGRKTANLIVGDVYKKPAVVADTHVIRITNLLGLTDSKDPKKVEMQLKKILKPEESNDFCHRIVLHGRAVCIARRPKCTECILKDVCKSGKEPK